MKGTKMSTPNGTMELPIQNTVFDLDSMDEVTLVKTVHFTPATSVEAALAVVGNDSAKFLEIINEGLKNHTRETAKEDVSIPWMVEDEEGNKTPFTGAPADSAKVNGLILNMAKSVFGYSKDMARDAKRAAKESAMGLIRNTPAIRDGLKAQASTK